MEQDLLQQFVGMVQPHRDFTNTSQSTQVEWFCEYDSDYARIVLSAPVRRLQDKTQVFPLKESDFARKRLTHSMEVASFARGFGRRVECELRDQLDAIEARIVSQNWLSKILEVASLVHDIGNPPFGHKGESAIQSFFTHLPQSDMPEAVKKAYESLTESQKADYCHFDGNVQGFRILTKLGLSRNSNSFNLTYPVLASMVKYPFSSLEGNQKQAVNHEQKKFGYFDSEKEIYNEIIQKLGITPGNRHPLTYLVEVADDIAYNVCDIEDGYHVGVLTLENIVAACDECDEGEWIRRCIKENEDPEISVQRIRIQSQIRMINDAGSRFMQLLPHYIAGDCKKGVLDHSDSANLLKAFKTLDIRNFQSDKVTEPEQKGCEALRYILEEYVKAVFSPNRNKAGTRENKIFKAMSENYWTVATRKNPDGTAPYSLFQYAVDQVAGMTDSFVLKTAEWMKELQ